MGGDVRADGAHARGPPHPPRLLCRPRPRPVLAPVTPPALLVQCSAPAPRRRARLAAAEERGEGPAGPSRWRPAACSQGQARGQCDLFMCLWARRAGGAAGSAERRQTELQAVSVPVGAGLRKRPGRAGAGPTRLGGALVRGTAREDRGRRGAWWLACGRGRDGSAGRVGNKNGNRAGIMNRKQSRNHESETKPES